MFLNFDLVSASALASSSVLLSVLEWSRYIGSSSDSDSTINCRVILLEPVELLFEVFLAIVEFFMLVLSLVFPNFVTPEVIFSTSVQWIFSLSRINRQSIVIPQDVYSINFLK